MSTEQGQSDMPDPHSQRDPVEALATEFVERLRRGEHPSVAEYVARHPELAADIHELFPTIVAMEHAKTPRDAMPAGRASLGGVVPERLGDFRIIREIGRGGMGIVYEAEQISLGRRVALKVLPRLAMLNVKHVARFQREARTAAGLHHTNIVPVFGVGRQDDYHYYVMQYIEGAGLDRVLTALERGDVRADSCDLGKIVVELAETAQSRDDLPNGSQADNGPGPSTPRVAALHTTRVIQDSAPELADRPTESSESPLSPAAGTPCWQNAARVGIQVAEALEYARGKGVLHRDIKPANLIVDRQGVVWVADFGLAKTLEQEQVSRTGEVLGTPAYVAPEQLRGQADHRSDIYSLGLTLYELLALRPAFQNADRALLVKRIATEEPPRLRQVRPQVPRDLETIVLKAIAHEPERRYQTAGELASDLRCFLEDRPIQARRATTAERLWRWYRRNPVVAALATTAAMLLLLVAVTASIGYASTNNALSAERTQRRRAEAATEVAVEVLDRIYDRFAPDLPGTTSDEAGNKSETDGVRKPMLSEGTAAVLEDMLVFYDRLAEQGGGEAAYLEKTAMASRKVGDIRHHLDQLDKAKAAYERSVDLYEQLDRSPGQTPHYLERVTTLTELGIVEDRLGQGKKAEASWNAAIQLAEQAAKAGVASEELDQATDRAHGFLDRLPEARPLRPLPLGPPDHRGPPLGPPDERFGEPPFRPLGPENGPRRPAAPPFGQP